MDRNSKIRALFSFRIEQYEHFSAMLSEYLYGTPERFRRYQDDYHNYWLGVAAGCKAAEFEEGVTFAGRVLGNIDNIVNDEEINNLLS